MYTFSQVANRYETTNPVISSRFGPDLNLRPIGKRARVQEHIVKFSKNCYGLFDGDIGDPIWDRHKPDGTQREWPGEATPYRRHAVRWEKRPEWIDDKTAKRSAAILWRLKRDGTEVITVRNANGHWNATNGRLAFLRAYLPREFHVPYVSNGRQKLFVRGLGYFYLARDPQMPASFISSMANYASRYKHQFGPYKTYRGDPASLKFQRKPGGVWEHVPGTGLAETREAVRVKKYEKAKLKPHIAALYEQVKAFYPMLTQNKHPWAFLSEFSEELAEAGARGYGGHWGSLQHLTVPALIDPQHPARLVLIKLFCYHLLCVATTYGDESAFRKVFNENVNKAFGLTYKTKIPV